MSSTKIILVELPGCFHTLLHIIEAMFWLQTLFCLSLDVTSEFLLQHMLLLSPNSLQFYSPWRAVGESWEIFRVVDLVFLQEKMGLPLIFLLIQLHLVVCTQQIHEYAGMNIIETLWVSFCMSDQNGQMRSKSKFTVLRVVSCYLCGSKFVTVHIFYAFGLYNLCSIKILWWFSPWSSFLWSSCVSKFGLPVAHLQFITRIGKNLLLKWWLTLCFYWFLLSNSL